METVVNNNETKPRSRGISWLAVALGIGLVLSLLLNLVLFIMVVAKFSSADAFLWAVMFLRLIRCCSFRSAG